MEKIAGVIVAGGEGTRMGVPKPLLPFGAGTLLDAVIALAQPQVDTLALNVPASDRKNYGGLYRQFPLLFDQAESRIGPLAGVLAGLAWLAGNPDVAWLATFPCDTPFLPRNLVAQLCAASVPKCVPVAARDADRTHALCALWPVECVDALRRGIASGRLRSMMSAIEALGGAAVPVECSLDAFFNVNTPDDLARAEEIRRLSAP